MNTLPINLNELVDKAAANGGYASVTYSLQSEASKPVVGEIPVKYYLANVDGSRTEYPTLNDLIDAIPAAKPVE